MSRIYVPPMTAAEKADMFCEMLARDYRCRVTITLDDRRGVTSTSEYDLSGVTNHTETTEHGKGE